MYMNIQQYKLAKDLLQNNHLAQVQVKHYSESKREGSWCDYNNNPRQSTIYLKPEDYSEDYKQMAIAVHEVGHAINYNENKHIRKIKVWTKLGGGGLALLGLLFLYVLVNLFAVLFSTSFLWIGYLIFTVPLIGLAIAFILIYVRFYLKDESDAWLKGKAAFENNSYVTNLVTRSQVLNYIDVRIIEDQLFIRKKYLSLTYILTILTLLVGYLTVILYIFKNT